MTDKTIEEAIIAKTLAEQQIKEILQSLNTTFNAQVSLWSSETLINSVEFKNMQIYDVSIEIKL